MMEREGDNTGFIDTIRDSLVYHANYGLIPDVHHALVKITGIIGKQGAGKFPGSPREKDKGTQQ